MSPLQNLKSEKAPEAICMFYIVQLVLSVMVTQKNGATTKKMLSRLAGAMDSLDIGQWT